MANLSPEQLARIQAYYAPQGGSGWSPSQATPYQEGGQVYQRDGDYIYNYDPNKQQAGQDPFQVYNPDGTFSNEGTFKTDDAMQTFLMALAAAGGMQFLPGGAFGGGGGAGGAAAGSGGSGGSGAFVGEGAMSGVGPWDAAALQNGIGTVAGDAYLPGMLGADGLLASTAPLPGTSLAGSLLAGGAGAAGGAAGAAGAAGSGAAGAAATGAGTLSKWLGPAATLLGAAAGAKGQEKSETTSKDIPEWLKPSVNKLLGYSGNLLDQQMAPGALQGFTDMQSVGRNLLSQPVAGNGFSRFFPGR